MLRLSEPDNWKAFQDNNRACNTGIINAFRNPKLCVNAESRVFFRAHTASTTQTPSTQLAHNRISSLVTAGASGKKPRSLSHQVWHLLWHSHKAYIRTHIDTQSHARISTPTWISVYKCMYALFRLRLWRERCGRRHPTQRNPRIRRWAVSRVRVRTGHRRAGGDGIMRVFVVSRDDTVRKRLDCTGTGDCCKSGDSRSFAWCTGGGIVCVGSDLAFVNTTLNLLVVCCIRRVWEPDRAT